MTSCSLYFIEHCTFTTYIELFPDHRSSLATYVSSSCHFHCQKVLQY